MHLRHYNGISIILIEFDSYCTFHISGLVSQLINVWEVNISFWLATPSCRSVITDKRFQT